MNVDRSGAIQLTHSSMGIFVDAIAASWNHVSFSWHPYLWTVLFLETFFDSLLSKPHSFAMAFAWQHFSCFLSFLTLIWRPLSLTVFPLTPSALTFFWHFLPCKQNSSCVLRLARSGYCTTKTVQSKYLPGPLRTAKCAKSTSQSPVNPHEVSVKNPRSKFHAGQRIKLQPQWKLINGRSPLIRGKEGLHLYYYNLLHTDIRWLHSPYVSNI